MSKQINDSNELEQHSTARVKYSSVKLGIHESVPQKTQEREDLAERKRVHSSPFIHDEELGGDDHLQKYMNETICSEIWVEHLPLSDLACTPLDNYPDLKPIKEANYLDFWE